MNRRLDEELRRWILTQPGAFEGPTREDCIEAAMEAVGVVVRVEEFARALDRLGYAPRQRRSFGEGTGFYWQIAFPSRQPASPPVDRRRG